LACPREPSAPVDSPLGIFEGPVSLDCSEGIGWMWRAPRALCEFPVPFGSTVIGTWILTRFLNSVDMGETFFMPGVREIESLQHASSAININATENDDADVFKAIVLMML
jgi:hypothetical protein